METRGFSKYQNATELSSGGLYIASRADQVYLVMAVRPLFDDEYLSILILKQIVGEAFKTPYIIIEGASFAYESRYYEITDCVVAPDSFPGDVQMTPHSSADPGCINFADGKLLLSACVKGGQKVYVDPISGHTEFASARRMFWTKSWSICKANIKGELTPIHVHR